MSGPKDLERLRAEFLELERMSEPQLKISENPDGSARGVISIGLLGELPRESDNLGTPKAAIKVTDTVEGYFDFGESADYPTGDSAYVYPYLPPKEQSLIQDMVERHAKNRLDRRCSKIETFLRENNADPTIHRHVVYRMEESEGRLFDEIHVLMPIEVNPEGVTAEQACGRFPHRRIWEEVRIGAKL